MSRSGPRYARIDFLAGRYKLTGADAYLVAIDVADFRITQLGNGKKKPIRC